MRFFEFDTDDLHEEFWVLWRLDVRRRVELRGEYRSFVCKKCGRVDVLAALRSGLANDIPPITERRDFALSKENLNVVSRYVVDALSSIPGILFEKFVIPTMPDHFVIYPQQLFGPSPDSPVFRPIDPHQHGEPFQVRRFPCKKCGRFGSVTFYFEWFSVPENVRFAGVEVEHLRAPRIVLFASEDVVNGLRPFSFSGLRFLGQDRGGKVDATL